MKLPVLFLFVAVAILFPSRGWSDEPDILDSLKGHELGIKTQDPQSGRIVSVKYGDPHLARVEEYLSDIPRPWTVPKMIDIFKKERETSLKIMALPRQTKSDAEERQRQWLRESERFESLARLLAASRDPRAAVALGDTFDRWDPEQPIVISALFDYFVGDMYYGLAPDDKSRRVEFGNMFEFTIPATMRWWHDNQARLRKEAAALAKEQ
jgi:hypothetical protein